MLMTIERIQDTYIVDYDSRVDRNQRHAFTANQLGQFLFEKLDQHLFLNLLPSIIERKRVIDEREASRADWEAYRLAESKWIEKQLERSRIHMPYGYSIDEINSRERRHADYLTKLYGTSGEVFHTRAEIFEHANQIVLARNDPPAYSTAPGLLPEDYVHQ